jgi:hypothetical protein
VELDEYEDGQNAVQGDAGGWDELIADLADDEGFVDHDDDDVYVQDVA